MSLLVPARKERFAILQVGINKYPSSPLNGCVNDVYQMDALFRQMRWTPSSRRVLLDGQATRDNMRTGMDWLIKQRLPVLIFQYSGHGTILRDDNGDEPSKIDGALCPVDYTRNGFIRDDEFGAMADCLLPGQRLILFFDSCYSGAAQRGNALGRVRSWWRQTRPRMVRSEAVIPGDATYDPTTNLSFNSDKSILIATAQPNVLADDAYIAGQYRGAGTYALMTAWSKLGTRGDYESIVSTANVWLASNGHAQRIMYGGTRYHFGRPFLT